MAYKIQSIQDFEANLNTYLQEHPLELAFEENLINNFSSSNLSDLYKLFLDLENVELNEDLSNKLFDILQKRFGINPEKIFYFNDDVICISKENIHILESIIKNKYLDCISEVDTTIDEKEIYNLSLIVNKIFPEVFQNLIKEPNNDISQQQNFIRNKILSTIEHWSSHNTKEAEEENRDITGALYITAKKLYPDLNIYIPGRIKSTKSSLANINKEIYKSLLKIIPSDLTKGISYDDVEKQFNLDNANSDFSGFTIVLANTDDVLHFDKSDPKSAEILKLRKTRKDNIDFVHSLENFLSYNDETYFSNIELLQIKIDLLTRLRECTYSECTKEFHGTSFNNLLADTIEKYHQIVNNSSIEQSYSDDDMYLLELDEIEHLLEELKKRVHDKYQAKILEIVIPEILADEIFSNTLKLKPAFEKNVRKKNGFCSLYYSLTTFNGRKIELQAQSQMRFKDSKDGSSDHSKLPNKTIEISHFFEPANVDCDEQQFEHFLNILNTTPVATKTLLNQTPDLQLSPRDKRLKRKIKIAEQNVKLKDYYDFEYRQADGSIEITKFPMEKYLPIFAEYVSPKLMSVSSHHTRFHKSVAGYNKKSLISGFTEVLLKQDATTCLAQQLIDKLESLVPNDKSEVSLNGINQRSALRQQALQDTDSFEH